MPSQGGLGFQFDRHAAVGQLPFQLQHELVDHAVDDLGGQRVEGDDGIEAIAEFRREHAVDGFRIVALALPALEADGGLGQIGSAGIGGHDQDHVAEIDHLAVMIGQFAVIHHLQKDVVEIDMRLLDFVEQQHAMRMLIDRIGQ